RTGAGECCLVIADLNQDGHDDVILSDPIGQKAHVYLSGFGGHFSPSIDVPTARGPVYHLVVADFDGDGIPDLATANGQPWDISIFHGRGDGGFDGGSILPVGQPSGSLAVGDFNGDGHADLVTTSIEGSPTYDKGLWLFLGNGDG